MVRLNLPERIETDRLLIQRLRYEDAEEIFFGYASKPEATKFVSWPTHTSIEDTRIFLHYAHAAWSTGTDYSFSIRLKQNDQFVGSIGFINENGKIQFGYVVCPSKWGRGFATETVSRMMDLLRREEAVFRIYTFVDVENVASQKVLLKGGLVKEAELRNWFRFVNQGNRPKDCILFRLPLEQTRSVRGV
ncbi:MAG TPA: GNAT family N-acetyltransferase [Cyclobacteriaceae bacterium]|nr:GNAT family N-acetyltransferase [Cyclobacteriaceae bacterium]